MSNSLIEAQNRFFHSQAMRILENVDINVSVAEQSKLYYTIKEITFLAFQAGAKWNFINTSKASPHINQFLEMVILLGLLDPEREESYESSQKSISETARISSKKSLDGELLGD